MKTPLQDPELIELRAAYCQDPTWVTWGNTQYDWIRRTLQEWDENPYIIWRAAIQHYPIFPLHYSPSDFAGIVNVFLPMLMAHNFDLYLCGHEHLLGYTQIPYATYSSQRYETIFETERRQLATCSYNVVEWFGNPETLLHSAV